jgi:hypothetical protein
VLQVVGDDAVANAGDRNYLVLAKPNVIMNDIRLRGWELQEVMVLVGRTRTTMPRPFGTLDAPSECGPPVPG